MALCGQTRIDAVDRGICCRATIPVRPEGCRVPAPRGVREREVGDGAGVGQVEPLQPGQDARAAVRRSRCR